MNERELYEQACKDRAFANGREYEPHYFKRRSVDDSYLNQSAEHGWQIWQAARANPVVPDGLTLATRSMGRLILRFESSSKLNDFYYACRVLPEEDV